jgi:hypothetical protein
VNPVLLYRLAAILLVLFAAGHQLGFRRAAPEWHAEAVVQAMQGTRFSVQGFNRGYWDFFSGFGFFVTILLLFSAVLAWRLAGISSVARGELSLVCWAFALAYVGIAAMTWRYFFVAPGIFASVVAACLLLAAWAGTLAQV